MEFFGPITAYSSSRFGSGAMPALLKAFLEQVIRPGVAFEYGRRGAFPKKLLAGRSARVVVTMGMPALLYRIWFRGHGVATLRRSILSLAGISPVRETLIGSVLDPKTKRWILRMRRLGSRAA